MSNKKAVLAIMPLTLLVGVLSLSLSSPKQKNANGNFVVARTTLKNQVSHDGEATLIDNSVLKTKLLASSLSETAQSFSISFSTGGVGWYNGMNKTVIVSSEDPEFEEYYNEFNKKTEEEKNAMLEEEGFTPRYFSSYLYSINVSKSAEVIIPKQLWRGGSFDEEKTIKTKDENGDEVTIPNPNYGKWGGGWFYLEPNSINNPVATSWAKSKVQNIYIPSTITTISSSAFEGIPDTVTIHLECSQDEIPSDFAEGWNHGATVEYGYPYEENFGYNEEVKSLAYQNSISTTFQQEFGNKDINYYIGYYDENDYYPLIAKYHLVGSTEEKEFVFTKTNKGGIYDAVGYELVAFTTDITCDIPIDGSKNEEIDASSIQLFNIFPAKEEGGVLIPDFSQEYYVEASKSYGNPTYIADFVSCNYVGASTFMGYTNIRMTADITNPDIYSTLKPSYFSQYHEEISKNKYHIRYRFTSLANVDFFATYDGEERIVNVLSPIKQTVLTKKSGNLISFLIKNDAFGEGFSIGKLQRFSFKSLNVTIDIITHEGKPIARSNTTARFANVVVMPYNENGTSYLDINALLLIESLSYIALFAIVSVALFFYLKKKYRNDEFRRMKPKSYIKKAILALLGSIIVLLEVTFIILRTGVFADSVIVFNPTDVFIIILGILSILIIGYFGRYVYLSAKANKERRRAIKLKLDEDVADDGTK